MFNLSFASRSMFVRTSMPVHTRRFVSTVLSTQVPTSHRTTTPEQDPTTGLNFTQIRFRSNRSRRGLYDGKDIRSGNNVSFSMKSTKRKFKPNVFVKRVYSEILDDMIPFHLTTSTLRSIDKAGGLDNYLLSPRRTFTEGEGYVVRKKLLKRLKNQERIQRKQEQEQQTSMESSSSSSA